MKSGRYLYTEDELIEDAKKYKKRNEWNKKNYCMYISAKNRGSDFFEKCCSHMDLVKKWTVQEIHDEAKKYLFKKDFDKYSPNAYAAARRKNILDSVCSHMKNKINRYDDETVIKNAKKCFSKVEFATTFKSQYAYACRNNILEKCCEHMKKYVIDYNKTGFLYYVSIDNGQYYKIGITTKNIKKRFANSHKRMKIIFFTEFKTLRDAKDAELEILRKYKRYKINDKIIENGNSEIFSFDVLGLDIN